MKFNPYDMTKKLKRTNNILVVFDNYKAFVLHIIILIDKFKDN